MHIVEQGLATGPALISGEGCRTVANPCVLPSGRWLVTHRAGTNKESLTQRVLLTWSDDHGRTWSQPAEPVGAPPVVQGRQGTFRASGCTSLGASRVLLVLSWVDVSDPTRPFFDEKTESLLNCETFWAVSEDDGEIWSEPRLVTPDRYAEFSRPITGPMLLLGDGRWGCQYELNKTYDMTGPWSHLPVICFSDDEGANWKDSVVPAHDADDRVFYWDQRPNVMPDGTIMNIFWTYDRVASRYLNIHMSSSSDQGQTWSAVWDTGVAGQPANVQPWGDGQILMVYVDRTDEPAIKARTSSDGGRHFPNDTEFVIHRRSDLPGEDNAKAVTNMGEAWQEMYAFSVGLPATSRLADGRVLVTWYTGPEATNTDIAWALLAPD